MKTLSKYKLWGLFEYLNCRVICPLLAFDDLSLLFTHVLRILRQTPGFFGRTYAYGAMSLAFVCAVKNKSSDEVVNFILGLGWIHDIDEADGSRWMDMGSREIALDLILKTENRQNAVKTFIVR